VEKLVGIPAQGLAVDKGGYWKTVRGGRKFSIPRRELDPLCLSRAIMEKGSLVCLLREPAKIRGQGGEKTDNDT